MKIFLSLLFLCQFSWASERNKNEEYLALQMSELAYKGFSNNAKNTMEELPESLESAEIAFMDRKQFSKSSSKNDSAQATWGITGTTLDETPQIYLAFKGTSTAKELKLDFCNCEATSNKDLEILIHDGMNKLISSHRKLLPIIEGLFKSWKEMTRDTKRKAQLIITGHSLGGGLAQIFGAYMKDRKFRKRIEKLNDHEPKISKFSAFLAKSKIYTFGAPQVFRKNHKFGTPDWVDELEKSSFHFVNQNDPVPLLNILKERHVVEILKNGCNIIKNHKKDNACGLWQALKEKGLECVGLMAIDVLEACFTDCSYKQYGTIYYLSGSRPVKPMDLNQLKKKAGSLKKCMENRKGSWADFLICKMLTVTEHFMQSYKENYVNQELAIEALPSPKSSSFISDDCSDTESISTTETSLENIKNP